MAASVARPHPHVADADDARPGGSPEGGRREEILDLASQLVATSGLTLSMQDIADSCGILPGSLYHHFESKEAIVIELVRRYRDDLDWIAADAMARFAHDDRPVTDQVVQLGEAISACAVRHRAALLVTLYEPPADAGDELVRLVLQAPTAVHDAMLRILERGREQGEVRATVDVLLLADRLCQSMLHHGVGDSPTTPGALRIPELRCRIVLEGLAARPVAASALDRSAPMQAARAAIASWTADDGENRAARVRSVARTAFGRHGYRTTTMRDLAAEAGLSIASVYRCYRSKQEILTAVMEPFGSARRDGWESVIVAPAKSVLETIDALAYLNIVLADRYRDELRIQLGLLRERPGVLRRLGSTDAQRRALKQLLATGARAGDVRPERGSVDLFVRCLYEALWTPENVVRDAGVGGAHTLARETILAGALTRPRAGGGRAAAARAIAGTD